jgi:hypothetical protein
MVKQLYLIVGINKQLLINNIHSYFLCYNL